jgi:hypothetical protein
MFEFILQSACKLLNDQGLCINRYVIYLSTYVEGNMARSSFGAG